MIYFHSFGYFKWDFENYQPEIRSDIGVKHCSLSKLEINVMFSNLRIC